MRGGNGIKKIEKVAIVTIYSRLNYGNRLQNYAIQEILKGIGVEPFTIKNFSKFGLFRKKMNPDFTIGEQKTRQDKLYDIKKEIFLKFNEQYLQTYEKDIDMNNIYNNQNILDGFDCFVVGSDQVWNYNIKSLSELNFLPFDTDKKKISFAASLCLDSINDDFKPYYKNYLSKFSSISVREEKAKEILENLLHRDIERVIEPILMISRNKWEEIMVKPEYELKNKYILIYMISDLPINNKISKYAQDNNLEIIDINSISSEYFLTSPNEFIYLMKNSELVITDSYHAGIFALIFNKRCQLYKRSGNYEGMNCRLDTIKELLNLDSESDFQEYEDHVEFKNKQDIYTNQTTISKTNKALNFLKSNMKERNNNMTEIKKLEEVRHIITMHCNLECLHCYLKGGGENNTIVQTIIDEDVLNKFYLKYKPDVVSATGGEPLLNKKMVKLLGKVINKYGGALEVVTNGTLIDEDFVDKLQEINPKTFYQISLDGMKEYHNFLRNSSTAFDRAMRGIKIVSNRKIRLKVRYTVTDQNYKDLPELIKLLESFNNENIELVIRPVVTCGRAKDNNLVFSKEYSILNNLKSDIIKISTTDNSGKCGCGVNTVAINDEGNIYPCNYTIGDKHYLMGNINEEVALFEDERFKSYGGNCYARRLQKLPVQK